MHRFRLESVALTHYLVKLLLTALLVVLASEVARRTPLFGALLASVPLISVLALTWLYVDTGDAERVASFSTEIFWMVLPSLAFFPLLSFLLRHRCSYYLSLAIALGAMFALYALAIWVRQRLGLRL
ncbi:DUF3147 family protein [Desulfuromonas soudanensis]|nr:DUF3147 family protein [Desulfuromonas soudanensis]